MVIYETKSTIPRLVTLGQFAFLFVLLVGLSGCQDKGVQASIPQTPAEVDVVLPLSRTITEWDEYTGRFDAVKRVDVRARVTGYLTEVRFDDGQAVKKGDVLFVIDPRPFQYAVQRARAQHALAKKDFERAQALLEAEAFSQEEFDRRLQVLKVAESRLNDAKLDLTFTHVKSPIDGKVSRDFVNVGNLVRENETLLTRLVSVDPIHFYFEASQADLLKSIRLDRAGKLPSSDKNPNPIFIKLPDEKEFLHEGRMDFVDNIIDPSTGTILGRALVPNPDAIIYPGLFGRARVMGSGEYQALLVPEKAINTDQSRKYVYVINEKNKAQRAYVELGPLQEGRFYIIRSGLKGNERIVVSGIQRIRATGQPVTPVKKQLDQS